MKEVSKVDFINQCLSRNHIFMSLIFCKKGFCCEKCSMHLSFRFHIEDTLLFPRKQRKKFLINLTNFFMIPFSSFEDLCIKQGFFFNYIITLHYYISYIIFIMQTLNRWNWEWMKSNLWALQKSKLNS